MKKIDYALENTNFDKEFMLENLCPNHLRLKDREDCEEAFHFEEDPCFKCWNEEIEED